MTHRASETINFREVGSDFRWIDIKLFDVPKPAARRELLESVIANPWYNDDYASPSGALPDPPRDIHGPFALDKITVASFSKVSRSECFDEISTWAAHLGPLPAEFTARFQARLSELLATASAVYRLEDLGREAEHQWGGHLGATGFLEYIVVSAATQSLALVVASDD